MGNKQRQEVIQNYLRTHKGEESMWLSYALGSEIAGDLNGRVKEWKEENAGASVNEE